MKIAVITLILGLFSLTGQAAPLACESVFADSSREVLKLTSMAEVINKPLSFVGKTIDETRSYRSYGTPFTVIPKESLPPFLQAAVDDIHLLSKYTDLREAVFGNSHSNREFATALLAKPLNVRQRSYEYEGTFVEVGVEVLSLNTGEKLYFYTTSNTFNSVSHDSGFFSSLIAQVKASGRSVVALDSFHTHPIDLLPSLNDRDFFSYEVQVALKEHPEIDISKWTVRTTIDIEPVLHEAKITDWLKP